MDVLFGADPDAPAIVDGERTWSYRRLRGAVDRLAATMAGRGVRPGGLVAVLSGRTPATVVAVLAAWRCGAAFLLVDPGLPVARRELLLAASAPTLVLDGELPAAGPPGSLVPASPDDPAYLGYTSGSAGAQKGVLVPYGGIPCIVAEQRRVLDAGPGARVYQAAPVGSGAFVFELLLALGTGACLVLPRSRAPLRARRVTHLVATPTALAALDPADLPDLRVVCSHGEACTPGVRDTWAARARLLNLYGPAEATIWASYAELSPDTDTGLIGRPVAGLAAQVCDERGAPLPTGRAGELYLSGPTVALGYHGRPDLTAGRFSTAPDGSRRYRTGDVVVAAADGQLSFRGRVDRRLDVRGVRIEPEEIERVVCEYPGVDLARAFLAEAGVLTAVYSPDRPPPTGVAAHLRERLPRWLVPQRIIGAAALPLGATGKVDERALRALGGNRVAEPDFAICAAVSGL